MATNTEDEEEIIKEKINVKILYNDDTYDVEITKGTKLDISELDFVSNKSSAFLLYGENFDTKYNNETLNEDVTFLACDYSGTELLGTFYTLQDAYTQGIISDGDLQDVYNNYTTSNEPKLDKQVELKILNDSLRPSTSTSSAMALTVAPTFDGLRCDVEIIEPTVVSPSSNLRATASIAAFSIKATIAGVASTAMSPEPINSAVLPSATRITLWCFSPTSNILSAILFMFNYCSTLNTIGACLYYKYKNLI